MRSVYRLSPGWRYLFLACGAGMVTLALLLVLLEPRRSALEVTCEVLPILVLGCISIASERTSKIITSPEGVEYITMGWRIKVSWAGIKEVTENQFGVVNLVAKEPFFHRRTTNVLMRLLGMHQVLQLSPYITEIHDDPLLNTIAKSAPTAKVAELIARHPFKTEQYQKVGGIGLYYLGLLLGSSVLAILTRVGADYLEESGYTGMTMVSTIVIVSFVVGTIVYAAELLNYNAKIAGLSPLEIRAAATACYISPIILLLLSLVVGLLIWGVLRYYSIDFPEDLRGGFAVLVSVVLLTSSKRIAEGLASHHT